MKKNEYYSNCLLEAVKAKINNWEEVRILYLPPDNIYCNPHWLWSYHGKVYDFYTDEKMQYPWQLLWWKGSIREQDEEVYNRWRNRTDTRRAKGTMLAWLRSNSCKLP